MSRFFSSTSKGSVERSVTSIAKLAVSTTSGLSCIYGMSHEIDRQNCERVSALLLNLDYKIKAIWVVKRPINYDEQSKFDHWVLKIQAPPALISIDFLQYNKKGAFGLEFTTGTNADLRDFFYYFKVDKHGQRYRKKWKILSCVVPNYRDYKRYCNSNELKLLKDIQNSGKILNSIECNKKLNDIVDFIEEFTTDFKGGYNAVMNNCQHFVFKLYQYILGNKYQNKWKYVGSQLQTPYKDQKIKLMLNVDDDDSKISDEIENKQNN